MMFETGGQTDADEMREPPFVERRQLPDASCPTPRPQLWAAGADFPPRPAAPPSGPPTHCKPSFRSSTGQPSFGAAVLLVVGRS